MKTSLYLFLLIPLFSVAQNNMVGDYQYTIYNIKTLKSDYQIHLKADSTFMMSMYENKVCYSYSDTLQGKWQIVNNNVSFYDIDQPKYITKNKDNRLKDNEILIKEKCLRYYNLSDSIKLKLLALDINYNVLGSISPQQTKTEGDTLIAKFKIPKETFQIVYFNRYTQELDHYFYGGINLVGFRKYNTFEISQCGNVSSRPLQFHNPFIQFSIESDGSLKSVKPFKYYSQKLEFRVFKKMPSDLAIDN